MVRNLQVCGVLARVAVEWVLLVVAEDLKHDGLGLDVVDKGFGHGDGDLRRGRGKRLFMFVWRIHTLKHLSTYI